MVPDTTDITTNLILKIKMASTSKFIGPGILLFLDQSLIAAINWLYWLVISKVSTTSEVGQATIVTSLVLLIGTIIQLGLEYPLLKRTSTERSHVFGTILVIQLVFASACVPITIYAFNRLFDQSLHTFIWIAIVMLVLQGITFVSRFALLGVSNVKIILLIDILGTVIKFLVAFIMVASGFGAFGILLSFLCQWLIFAGISLVLAKTMLGFSIGSMRYFKEIIKEGIANFPSKLSGIFIVSLSVVLLASFNLSSSEIGIYYVAVMISFIIGTFASSMAHMVIPASSTSNKDLSTDSMRISLSLTAPLIAGLLVAPMYALSLVGAQYISGYLVLLVLSMAVLPSTIVVNTISKLNNLNQSRRLLTIGAILVLTFFGAFFSLVPLYGSLGAAFATLIAFICTSIPSIIWSESVVRRYLRNSVVALISGVVAGYLIGLLLSQEISPPLRVMISIAVTMTIVMGLKNTSALELKQIVREVISRK
jgi:O-antigen/teichoic acid export membrane protein